MDYHFKCFNNLKDLHMWHSNTVQSKYTLKSTMLSLRLLFLTWETRSMWGCGRTGERLWGTYRSRAAPLRSDTQHTSLHWDLPPARLSSLSLAALQVAAFGLWRLVERLGQMNMSSAAAVALN